MEAGCFNQYRYKLRPSAQYETTMKLADRAQFVTASAGAELSFTGHSLGGALASAASATTGKSATTFSAAGLHPRTVTLYYGIQECPDESD